MSKYGMGTNGFPLTGRYRIERKGKMWATLRETEKYGGSWEWVPYIALKPTATQQIALTRNSVNNLTQFKRTTGRGNAVYTAYVKLDD